MSEYQYYEFAAVDGPISDEGMQYAEGCSSRAEVSRFRWRNVYNYGDFHGSEVALLKYYDAHFYIASWGVVRFGLAFPEGCLNQKAIQSYLRGNDRHEETLRFQNTDGRFIVWWDRNEEVGWGWTEGEGIIDNLIGIREDLICGDYRALFLGWLAEFCPDDWEDPRNSGVLVPPIPTGLDCLTFSLQALIEQFPVDPDALTVAARHSQDAISGHIPIAVILDKLPVPELRALLQSVAEGQGARVMSLLNQLTCPPAEKPAHALTCVDFARQAIDARGARLRKQERAEAAERKRADAAHRRHLESVMQRADAIWARMDLTMDRKNASAYDDVAARLNELRNAYNQAGKDAEFHDRIDTFRARFKRRPAMMRRIADLGRQTDNA